MRSAHRFRRTLELAAALAAILTVILGFLSWYIPQISLTKEPGPPGAPPIETASPAPVRVVVSTEIKRSVVVTHVREVVPSPPPTIEEKVAPPQVQPAVAVVIQPSSAPVPSKPPLTESSLALLDATELGNHDSVKRWLAGGADPNAAARDEKTPLIFAAERGHHDICKTLISAGALLSLKDHRGRTALHYAAAGGHNEVVKYLLDHGASAVAVDAESKTPLDLAQLGAHNTTAGVIQKALGKPRQ